MCGRFPVSKYVPGLLWLMVAAVFVAGCRKAPERHRHSESLNGGNHVLFYEGERPFPAEAVQAFSIALNAMRDMFSVRFEDRPLTVMLQTESDFRRSHPALHRHAKAFLEGTTIHVVWEHDKPGVSSLRLCHEMAHWSIQQQFPDCGIPLWLDEGLAALLTARTRHTFERVYQRTLDEAANKTDGDVFAFSLDELTGLADYPLKKAGIDAFYEQSEKLVAVLYDRLGTKHFLGYVGELCDGGFWQEPLRRDFYYNDGDFLRMENAIARQKDCSP